MPRSRATNAPSPMYPSRAHRKDCMALSRRDSTMRVKTDGGGSALAALPSCIALLAMRLGIVKGAHLLVAPLYSASLGHLSCRNKKGADILRLQ